MLQLRPNQMQALRAAQRKIFAARLHEHLQARAPAYLKGLDPKTARAEVTAIIDDAQAMGLAHRDQVRRYALVAAFAKGRADCALPDWFWDIALRDRPSPPLRLLELEDALIHLGRAPLPRPA